MRDAMEDIEKVCREYKDILMLITSNTLFSLLVAHEIVVEKKQDEAYLVLRKMLEEVSKKERPVFSDYFQAMQHYGILRRKGMKLAHLSQFGCRRGQNWEFLGPNLLKSGLRGSRNRL